MQYTCTQRVYICPYYVHAHDQRSDRRGGNSKGVCKSKNANLRIRFPNIHTISNTIRTTLAPHTAYSSEVGTHRSPTRRKRFPRHFQLPRTTAPVPQLDRHALCLSSRLRALRQRRRRPQQVARRLMSSRKHSRARGGRGAELRRQSSAACSSFLEGRSSGVGLGPAKR